MGAVGSVRGAFDRMVHLLLPPACHGCRSPLTPGQEQVCQQCRTLLRPGGHPRCSRCHAPRGTGVHPSRPCPECVHWPSELNRARWSYVLAPPADALVHGLKYDGWPELAGFMAHRMARLVPPLKLPEETRLVPVPTTSERERSRGYNQAHLLAWHLSRELGFPLLPGLARQGGGGTQVSLQRDERRANVEEAFRPVPGASTSLKDRVVLLVDDVLTTGATASAAARVLGAMGASHVTLLAFARTLDGSGAEGG